MLMWTKQKAPPPARNVQATIVGMYPTRMPRHKRNRCSGAPIFALLSSLCIQVDAIRCAAPSPWETPSSLFLQTEKGGGGGMSNNTRWPICTSERLFFQAGLLPGSVLLQLTFNPFVKQRCPGYDLLFAPLRSSPALLLFSQQCSSPGHCTFNALHIFCCVQTPKSRWKVSNSGPYLRWTG